MSEAPVDFLTAGLVAGIVLIVLAGIIAMIAKASPVGEEVDKEGFKIEEE